MKVLMDSDCLIKITRAGIKEVVVACISVFIPKVVPLRVVDARFAKNLPDALVVQENIKHGKVKTVSSRKQFASGDMALIELFSPKKFSLVATDDAKLIHFLRFKNIPFVLPPTLNIDGGINEASKNNPHL